MAKKGGAFPARSDHLRLLLEISGALAALHESKTLFQKITDFSVELLKLGSAAIYLLEGENLRLEATFPPLPAEFPDELRYASQNDHPRVQQALLTGEPVLVADTRGAEQTQAEKDINTLRSLRSLLFLPLIYQDKRLGVLIIGSVDEPHKFTADEVDVCQSLANLAAMQIEVTRQHEANQGYIAMLEREIEERRNAESRLEESEARYRALFEESPVSLWEEDYSAVRRCFEELRAQGIPDLGAFLAANPEEVARCASLVRIIDVNQASLELYKAPSKDDLKGNLVKILGAGKGQTIDERSRYHEELIWLAEGRSRFSFEAVNRTLDGGLIDIQITCMIPPEHEKDWGRLIFAITDISERKRAEKELISSEARFRLLIENAPDGIFVQTEHKFAYLNPAAVRLFGAEQADDLLGTPVLERFHPDYHAIVKERIQNLNVGKTSVPTIEEVFLKLDGQPFDVEVSAVPIQWEGKDGALVFFQDISERKKSEEALRESEERFRLFFQSANVGYSMTDLEGRISVNQAYADLLGYTLEELEGKTWQELTPPEEIKPIEAILAPILAGETDSARFEKRYIRKDGMMVWTDVSTVLRRTSSGQPLYFITSIIDISDRMQMELALQHSNNLRHAILNATSESVYLTDLDGRVLDTNEMTAQRFGKTGTELTGTNIFELLPPNLAEARKEKVRKAAREAKPQRFEDQESDRWYEHSIYPVGDDLGTVTAVAIYSQDITERRLVENALKEREERFRRLAENAQDLIYRMRLSDPRGFEYINPSATTITGYTPEEHYADPDLGTKVAHPEDRPLLEALASGKVDPTQPLVLRWVRKDGEVIWTEQRNVPVFDEKNNLIAIEGIARDITERKRTQEAEKELARRIEAGMRAGNLAWWEMELPSGKVRFDNRKAEMLGYEPGRFKTYRDFTRLLHPDDKKKAMQAMQDHLDGKKETYEVEYRIRTSDGSYKWLRDIGAITERDPHSGSMLVIGIVDDVSRRKEAELALEAYSSRLEDLVAERTRALNEAQQELIEKEKLATLGQLAGGVGHELRNPLGVINNAVYILKASVAEENEKAREYADMIAQQVQRSNKIISDLLNFAREPSANRVKTDLDALAARVLADFPPPEGIRVRKTIAKGQPKALADAQHVEQILANLVSNAYQAMPEGGQVSVSVSRRRGEVCLAVRDSGAGISPENLEKLFIPLFTTKAKGIGLGLATSKKLAEANGGRIEVKSEVGKGSTFTLVLPAAGEENGG